MNAETNRTAYERRIQRVIQHVCSNLEHELSLAELTRLAGFSKYHFHRQFTAYAGVPLGQFVRRTRLKFASYQLAFDETRSVLQVALDAGFAGPEAFSRAFRDVHGQSPSEFRRAPGWGGRENELHLPAHVESNVMNPKIVEFEGVRVAVLEHQGAPETLMKSVARFVAWRKASGNSPIAVCRTLGIAHSDPESVAPEEFRFDICAELKGALDDNDAGVVEKWIPSGRCAVVRHVGSTDALGQSLHRLYGSWLPASGEQLRDFPLFFHYIERMPQVREHEQVTDIYLPLAATTATAS